MSKKHLVVPDPHAAPGYSNVRADWIGRLILDERPDTVIVLGDLADFPSLSSYDKGKKSFQGRTYKADITSALEFNDRLWAPIRAAKKRLPYRVILEGNHEYRITRAIELQPELEGAIGFDDLDYHRYYDEVVRYRGSSPGIIEVDGVAYAHYFISGVMGRPIAGEHPAYSLLSKGFVSATAGHLHTLDYCVRTNAHGIRQQCLIAGVGQDYDSPFAGNANDLWWRGVVIKRNVEKGSYSPQFITLDELKKEYGNG